MVNVAASTTTYTLRDDNGDEEEIEATSLADAREQAEEWVRGGDWSPEECGPIHVHVRILDEEDYCVESVDVTIEQPAPPCMDGERDTHVWESPIELVGGCKENPGVWGHGGGVIIKQVCLRCGCVQVTDTWAQNRSTGQQGLTETTYEECKFASEVYALAESEIVWSVRNEPTVDDIVAVKIDGSHPLFGSIEYTLDGDDVDGGDATGDFACGDGWPSPPSATLTEARELNEDA